MLLTLRAFKDILLFAAPDHLPEVPDHHADPDPGSAAVCRASVPHC